ncbi:peptidase M28-like protein [Flavobacteriaceae bacterium MAR_2010_105]|nr:peptidase M28-like protein [Flavobacteriaceae bacterium MAR_2010_105]
MKVFIFASALSLVGSCATLRYTEKIQNIKDRIIFNDVEQIESYANSITSDELKDHVYKLSSDSFYGRKTGDVGFNKAANYLKEFYLKQGILSPLGDTHFQYIPKSFFFKDIEGSQNIIAYIEGSEFPNEILIISGHADHLGTKDNQIYYGADDNGSGTAAILEMAQAFHLAQQNGYGPKRSILFLHLTGEEEGLEGSRYYTKYPIFPLKNTIANLNMDMIGRVDKFHEENPNYVYIIGADRLSTELHYISEAANNHFTQLDLDYKFNSENDNNRYYYRSDHYNFAQHNIPVIFYFDGEHEDYHQPSDTPDKLNYALLQKRTQLIFTTAWYLANCNKRISVDKI